MSPLDPCRLTCLALGMLPFSLLLFDPTIGFSLPSLRDCSISSAHAQAHVFMFTQKLRNCGC